MNSFSDKRLWPSSLCYAFTATSSKQPTNGTFSTLGPSLLYSSYHSDYTVSSVHKQASHLVAVPCDSNSQNVFVININYQTYEVTIQRNKTKCAGAAVRKRKCIIATLKNYLLIKGYSPDDTALRVQKTLHVCNLINSILIFHTKWFKASLTI